MYNIIIFPHLACSLVAIAVSCVWVSYEFYARPLLLLLIQLQFIVVIFTKLCLVWTTNWILYSIPVNVLKLCNHFRLNPSLDETFLWPHTKAFFYFNSKLFNETFYRAAVVTHFISTFFLSCWFTQRDSSCYSIYPKQSQF